MPRWYGGGPGPGGEYAVFLEEVARPLLTDPGGELAGWAGEHIDAALEAVARIHAAFLGRSDRLAALSWPAPRADTASFSRDADLWRDVVDDARRRQPAIVDERTWRRRHRLIDEIGAWHPAKDAMPSSLVHDDYNQRNVGFRAGPDGRPGEVIVFDWEVVSVDAPQRDVVELLTFALPPDVDRRRVDGHVETWRRALDAAAAVAVDDKIVRAAFVAELKVQALNRVGLQLLVGAAFPLPYLARINTTIERLLDLYAD